MIDFLCRVGRIKHTLKTGERNIRMISPQEVERAKREELPRLARTRSEFPISTSGSSGSSGVGNRV